MESGLVVLPGARLLKQKSRIAGIALEMDTYVLHVQKIIINVNKHVYCEK